MRCILSFVFVLALALPSYTQSRAEERELLGLVDELFKALEEQDTATFRNMFVDNGYLYAVLERSPDSVLVSARLPSQYRFRPGEVVRERMRKAETTVKVTGRVAMVWAPYDLWINETFSHCGVDVFTFVRSSGGWKIASLAYTIERPCK